MINVFSKESLYEVGNKNKAYILHGSTMTDVASLGFTEPINPETTRGTSDSSNYCNYVILNGKLFYYNTSNKTITRVGNLTNWTAVSGISSSTYYAYGIAGGKLYRLSSTTATQVGSLSNWTDISGYSNSSNCCAYGIAGGELYSLVGTTATQVGSLSNWTNISGYSNNNCCAYGITGGKLHSIAGTTVAQLVTNVSIVCGFTNKSDTSWFNFYITTAHKLFAIRYTAKNFIQIGNLTSWTAVSGITSKSSSSSRRAYGIAGGKLYYLLSTGGSTVSMVQVGSLTNWTAVSGYNADDVIYAYGIAGDDLYILNTTATQIGKATAIYGLSSDNYPTLAVYSA